MPWEAWFTLGIIALMAFALLRSLAGPDTVLLGGMTLLMLMSVISPYAAATPQQPGRPGFPGPTAMVSGFGNPGLVAIAVLFVVAGGLSQTGAMGLISHPLLGRPKHMLGAQVRMTFPVACMSAFMNNTPIVAMFVPVVTDWARRTGLSASKLLIPLSYAAVLGGTCSLIGTATNVYVYGQLDDELRRQFGMFTIAKVGVPAALVGIAYILIASHKLLPDRRGAAEDLADARRYTIEMLVEPGSAIAGRSIEQAGLRHLPGAFLTGIERDGHHMVAVGPEQVLRGNDRLIFAGIVDSVRDLQKIRGLAPATDQVFKLTDPRPDRRLVEAVVSDQCPLIGKSVREGRFRTTYNGVIIAVHRGGEHLHQKIGDIVLRPGDTLLIEAHPRFIDQHRNSRDFFLLSEVSDSQPIRHDKAWLALLILAGMIAMVSLKVLPLLTAALLAAGLIVVTRCCPPHAARAAINWRVLLAMGAAIGIGGALDTTGAAAALADAIRAVTAGFGPRGILAGIYLIAMVFNMLIGRVGAAAMVFPIAMATAGHEGLDFIPFVIVLMMAASADFANPISSPTHLMVYGAGGYKFVDFVRIGLPLNLLVMAVTVTLAPFFWPL